MKSYFDEKGFGEAYKAALRACEGINSFQELATAQGVKVSTEALKKALKANSIDPIEQAYKTEIAEGLPAGVKIELPGETWGPLRIAFLELSEPAKQLTWLTFNRGKARLLESAEATLKEQYTHEADEEALRLYKCLEKAIEVAMALGEFGPINQKHPFSDTWVNRCMNHYNSSSEYVKGINYEMCHKMIQRKRMATTAQA